MMNFQPAVVLILIMALMQTGMVMAAPEAVRSLTTLSGKHYHKVQIMAVDPDGLRITHRDGAAKIKFADLSRDLRAKYGYDAQAAAKFQVQQAEKWKAETARRAQAQQDAYNQFRREILVMIQTATSSNHAALAATIEDRIAHYRAENQMAWAKTLERDLAALNQNELARQSKAVDVRNEKLQEDIVQFQFALSQSQERSPAPVRRVTYYSPAFPYQYYYNQPRCYTPITPRPCPPVRSGPIIIVR